MPAVISHGEMLIDFVSTVNGVSLLEAPSFLKAPGGCLLYTSDAADE